MDGNAHAYTVRSDNGQVLLGAEGSGNGGSPTRFESLEQAAAKILLDELGIEVDRDVVAAFANEMLEPQMPEARVSSDELFRWIDV